VWGGLHGAYLIGERAVRGALPGGAWRERTSVRLAVAALTFVLVCIAWVFFRATSFAQAFALVAAMVGASGARVLSLVDYKLVVPAIAALLAVHWLLRERPLEDVVERTPWLVRSAALALMLVALVLMQGQDRAFIYFQF
jgi:D-alanyl-lipoteichoic acid acyltransferase DltB (MBOAT superfamily)